MVGIQKISIVLQVFNVTVKNGRNNWLITCGICKFAHLKEINSLIFMVVPFYWRETEYELKI